MRMDAMGGAGGQGGWMIEGLDHSASRAHWRTVWSSPPVEKSSSSLRLKRTVVTWLEWPLPFTLSLFFTRQGYSSTLISPLSLPVAMMFIPPAKVFLVRSMELMSVPSVQGSKMPWTGHPKVTFQVAHSQSLVKVAPEVTCLPVLTSQKSSSYAPQVECRQLPSLVKSKCLMQLLCLAILNRCFISPSFHANRQIAVSCEPIASTVPSGENLMWLISFWDTRLQSTGRSQGLSTRTVPSLQPITMNFSCETAQQRPFTESGKNFSLGLRVSGLSFSLNLRSTQVSCSFLSMSQSRRVPSSEQVAYLSSSRRARPQTSLVTQLGAKWPFMQLPRSRNSLLLLASLTRSCLHSSSQISLPRVPTISRLPSASMARMLLLTECSNSFSQLMLASASSVLALNSLIVLSLEPVIRTSSCRQSAFTAAECTFCDFEIELPLQMWTEPSDAPVQTRQSWAYTEQRILQFWPNTPVLPLTFLPLNSHSLKCLTPTLTKLLSPTHRMPRMTSRPPFSEASSAPLLMSKTQMQWSSSRPLAERYLSLTAIAETPFLTPLQALRDQPLLFHWWITGLAPISPVNIEERSLLQTMLMMSSVWLSKKRCSRGLSSIFIITPRAAVWQQTSLSERYFRLLRQSFVRQPCAQSSLRVTSGALPEPLQYGLVGSLIAPSHGFTAMNWSPSSSSISNQFPPLASSLAQTLRRGMSSISSASSTSTSSTSSSSESSSSSASSSLPSFPVTFHRMTVRSLPPTDSRCCSSALNLTLVTCELWPTKSLFCCFGIVTGYVKSLTRWSSPPVATSERVGLTLTQLMLLQSGSWWISCTQKPNLPDQVAHLVLRVAEAATGPLRLQNLSQYACETVASVSDSWLQSTDNRAEVMPALMMMDFWLNFFPSTSMISRWEAPPCAPKATYLPLGENLMSSIQKGSCRGLVLLNLVLPSSSRLSSESKRQILPLQSATTMSSPWLCSQSMPRTFSFILKQCSCCSDFMSKILTVESSPPVAKRCLSGDQLQAQSSPLQ